MMPIFTLLGLCMPPFLTDFVFRLSEETLVALGLAVIEQISRENSANFIKFLDDFAISQSDNKNIKFYFDEIYII